MKLIFSPPLFPQNNQIIPSPVRCVSQHVMNIFVSDLTFGNLKEQYGEELYEAGPARRKNSG